MHGAAYQSDHRKQERKREKNSQKKVTNEYFSSLTDVMVLFSEIDAAMAFPPSGPRPFADTSSYVHGRNEGGGVRNITASACLRKVLTEIRLGDAATPA